jgi:hypothetical protein
MNVVRAAAYVAPNPIKARSLFKIWLLVPIPVFGQLWAMGYANLALRRLVKGHDFRDLPEANADWRLFLRGVYATLLTLISMVVVGLLLAPLMATETADPAATSVTNYPPVLMQAIAGPTELLIQVLAAVIGAVVLTRYALTDSFLSALNPMEIWTHLRAEPAIWTYAAVIGFVVTYLPDLIAWALPLSYENDQLARMIIAPYFWMLGLMLSTHLMAQAYEWSQKTAAKRAANVGYRW